MRARLVLWSLVVLPFLGCPAAWAQGPGENDATSDTELARHSFEAGTSAYQAQDYPRALALFEAAYALTEAPELLYNLALVLEHLGREDEALGAYQRYLSSLAADPNRVEVQGRITNLEENAAERAAERAATEAAAEPMRATATPPPQNAGGTPAWLVMGGGGTLMLGGAAALVFTYLDIETVNAGGDWSDAQGAHERIPYLSTLGFSLLGVGVATLGTGLLFWLLRDSDAPSDDSAQEPTISLSVGPLGAVVWGRF